VICPRFTRVMALALFVLLGASDKVRAQDAGDDGRNARAQDPQGVTELVPFFWDRGEHVPRPDISAIEGIVFLTDSDYPPFNYRDAGGNLVGFNVDLAKAICAALRVRCRIAAQEWNQLIPTLLERNADAVIASLAIDADNRARVDFTYPYFRSPARFAARKQERAETATPEELADRKLGVRSGTAHEAFLRTFFAGSDIVTFGTAAEAREALRIGDIDALFGDSASLMFWLNGSNSRSCCRFIGGAYSESRFFGIGAGIAVAPGNTALIEALNFALDRIKVSGTYDRIYRKYFPLDLY